MFLQCSWPLNAAESLIAVEHYRFRSKIALVPEFNDYSMVQIRQTHYLLQISASQVLLAGFEQSTDYYHTD